MMNGDEYIRSLQAMKTVVYINGQKVRDYYSHPVMKPAVNTLAVTYDLASDPELDSDIHALIVTESDLTGGRVNRFLKILYNGPLNLDSVLSYTWERRMRRTKWRI